MFEHLWIEETCSWIVAPEGVLPAAGELASGEILFVWGFLMDPRFLQGVIGRAAPLAPAVVRGYRRETFFRDGRRGYRLVPGREGVVCGVVLLGLTRGEMEALDRFEQVPREMVRRTVEVRVGDLAREAWIYLAA